MSEAYDEARDKVQQWVAVNRQRMHIGSTLQDVIPEDLVETVKAYQQLCELEMLHGAEAIAALLKAYQSK